MVMTPPTLSIRLESLLIFSYLISVFLLSSGMSRSSMLRAFLKHVSQQHVYDLKSLGALLILKEKLSLSCWPPQISQTITLLTSFLCSCRSGRQQVVHGHVEQVRHFFSAPPAGCVSHLCDCLNKKN